VVFPWAEPILPFDDVQVGDPDGYSDVSDPGDATPAPQPSGDEHDIPYSTSEASPSPTPSRKR
jgi:hypothetical protein